MHAYYTYVALRYVNLPVSNRVTLGMFTARVCQVINWPYTLPVFLTSATTDFSPIRVVHHVRVAMRLFFENDNIFLTKKFSIFLHYEISIQFKCQCQIYAYYLRV